MYITIDTETLGNRYDAPIAQIAAVKFDINGKVHSTFNKHIKLSSLKKFGFQTRYSTLRWWFGQPARVIKSVFRTKNSVPIDKALQELKDWIGAQPGGYTYWTHASFDPPVISWAIDQVGMEEWIPFSNHRDIRTLLHLAGEDVREKTPRKGKAHNALDDCVYQAGYISLALRRLQAKGIQV